MRLLAILLVLVFSSTSASAAVMKTKLNVKQPSLRAPSISRSTVRTGKTVIMQPLGGFQCPSVPRGKFLPPSPPYDLILGDCALVGNGEEVEEYLTELEQIAQGCRDRVEAAWQAVEDARNELDDDIDDLPPPPPEEEEEEQTEDGSIGFLESMDPSPMICSSLQPSDSLAEPIGTLPEEGHYYTEWLQNIGENVQRYCTMVDELMKPIVEACEEIDEEAQCMVDDPAQLGVSDAMKNAFHSRVSGSMNAATLKHDYVLWYYENTLVTYGFGNFRQYFHEDAIECSSTSRSGLTGISPRFLLQKMGLSPAKSRVKSIQRGKTKTSLLKVRKSTTKNVDEKLRPMKQTRPSKRSFQ